MQTINNAKKNIILFFPDPKLEGLTWHRMPFSVLAISSLLIASNYNVKIFDERFSDNLEESIISSLPDSLCVGISAFTGNQITGALKISRLIKKKNPDIPVVWGGWHPSIFPEQTAMDPDVDIVVYGQGERTFIELVNAFAANKPIDGISGLCYVAGNRVIKTPPRPLEDINNFPPMPLDLINVPNYIGPHMGLEGAMTLSYMSSQGCPFRCGFCADKRVYQRRWFGLNSERVVKDITVLVNKYKLDAIYFEDNNFFVDKRRTEEICSGIISNKLNIKWEAMGHPRSLSRLDDNFWNLIRESGCRRILIGAESGDEAILELINKDANVDDTINFVKKAKKHKIIPILSTIVGFPESALKDMKKTIALVVKTKRLYRETEWKLFLYTPYPGTDLYDLALKYGMEEPCDLESWARHTLRDVKTPWINEKFRKNMRYVAFFYFQMAYPSKYVMQRIKRYKYIMPLVLMVQFIARVRLILNFYALPIEPIIYNFLKRIKKP